MGVISDNRFLKVRISLITLSTFTLLVSSPWDLKDLLFVFREPELLMISTLWLPFKLELIDKDEINIHIIYTHSQLNFGDDRWNVSQNSRPNVLSGQPVSLLCMENILHLTLQ